MFNYNISILNHIKELKCRMGYICFSTILTFLLTYCYSLELFYLFTKPLINLKIDHFEYSLIYTNITEAFFTYLNISLSVSFVFSVLFLIHQVIYFLTPGLYIKETLFLIKIKKIIFFISFISVLITYFFMIPLIWYFFLSNDTSNTISSINIHFEGKLNEYIFILLKVFFSIFCVFISPLILFILVKLNIISLNIIINQRKISFILIFLFCALLSPPEVISQIFLAIPLCINYELIILLSIYNNIT
jgi:sec-independent protein translocase protein TatC